MKSFVVKVSRFLFVLAIVLGLAIFFCVKIDPYNVFHPLDIRDNGVEPNKNYIKMTYILNNPDKFDSYIFGSSRVGNIHGDKIWSQKVYNMTYSSAVPSEALANIKTFLENGVHPKRIYLGVDSLSYTVDPEDHKTDAITAPYELKQSDPLSFYKLYLEPGMVLEAYTDVISKHKFDEHYAYRFYEFGWNVDYRDGDISSNFDFENGGPSIGDAYRLNETLAEIEEIVKLCQANSIELTVFTNPMWKVTHEASLDLDYYDFLRGLAKVTPFYNFSGYNEVTVDEGNWIDNSHFSAEVSDLLKESFCFNEYHFPLYDEGFGVLADENNVEELITTLERCRDHYLSTGIPY